MHIDLAGHLHGLVVTVFASAQRTAERIVVELREKVGSAPADDPIVVARGDDPRLLARDGLVGLGFSAAEAEPGPADEPLSALDAQNRVILQAELVRSIEMLHELNLQRCDRTTMTQNDFDNGRMICLIGVAVVKPAEFVIFRISQWQGGGDTSE